MVERKAIITELYVKHYGYNQYRKSSRRPLAEYAYMTLWCKTSQDRAVWLDTCHWLDTSSIESKTRKYEAANQHLLGKTITYDYNSARGIGFHRSLEDNLQPINPWEEENGR
ncbi:hypothetical protein HYT55_04975 [Candidatus Woesearchaeota archaeon]|nr:hypothetical protein [Candidatus Woesearchaeota archaeon]